MSSQQCCRVLASLVLLRAPGLKVVERGPDVLSGVEVMRTAYGHRGKLEVSHRSRKRVYSNFCKLISRGITVWWSYKAVSCASVSPPSSHPSDYLMFHLLPVGCRIHSTIALFKTRPAKVKLINVNDTQKIRSGRELALAENEKKNRYPSQ